MDFAIGAIIVLGSAIWGTQFWNQWTRQGGQPEFYQLYFEPAVMVACHKGFIISEQQSKILEDFLWRRRDSLQCSDLPADLKLSRKNMYQGAWTYLQYTVGLSWRVLGISWSGMGPLFGLFFGIVTGLSYAIFRLGMGRALAVVCAGGIATSSLHLVNLPHLRDYSKAPFTLALVLILGWLVTMRFNRARVMLLATAYGAVLGFGYGFRTDLLIDVPLVVITLFGFLDGGITRNLVVKGLATLVFVAAFFVVSLPITSAVVSRGGCQWHVALLGLQSPFEDTLRLTPAPYDFGHAYADGYITRLVQGYAHRMDPAAPPPGYCSPDYDVQSGRYLMTIVTTFPGDFVTRAYASTLQIVELPFAKLAPPAQDWARWVFSMREMMLRPRHSWGAPLAVLALVMVSTASIRLGLFVVFALAYIGGYPAVQFQERHYFHLEFIGWLVLGFVLHQVLVLSVAFTRTKIDLRALLRQSALRGAIVAAVGVVVLGSLLVVTRWYQQRQAKQLFASYLAAPREPIQAYDAPLAGISAREWPQYLAIELNEAACQANPTVTFRYDPAVPNGDFKRTVTLDRRSTAAGPTTILATVFESFTGLDVPDAPPGCVIGVSRITGLERLPLVLSATLPPDWQSRPLYQRIARFEGR